MLDLEDAGRRLSVAQLGPTPPVARLEAIRSRRARRRRIGALASAATVIAVTAGLAGWLTSNSAPPAHVSTAPGGVPSGSAAGVVHASVGRTEDAGSAAFEYTVSVGSPPAVSTWIGSVNFNAHQMSMTTYDGTPGPSSKTSEVRVIGATTYEKPYQHNLPGGGSHPWIKTTQKVDVFDWVFLPLSTTQLAVSYDGTATVQGTLSDAYTVHIPAGTVDGKPVAAYEIQVWLDHQGRIVQAASTRATLGATTATTTLRISRFGVPVAVTAPSPVETSTGPAPPSAVTPATTGGPDLSAGPTIAVTQCSTTYGAGRPPKAPDFPAIPVNLPESLATELSFYTTDTNGVPPVLGPAGWACTALVGADGSTILTIYPTGGAGPKPGTVGQPSVIARSDSACQGCVYGTVCRFVPGAASQLGYSSSGIGCGPAPAGESTYWIKGSASASYPINDVIAFHDPATPDSTDGVVLYDKPGQGNGAASEDDCTLPMSQHPLCTAILNNFSAQAWLMR